MCFTECFSQCFGCLILPAETLSVLDFKLQIPLCCECVLWYSGFLSTHRASEQWSSSTSLFGASFFCVFWIFLLLSVSVVPRSLPLSLWHAVPETHARDRGCFFKMEDSLASDYRQAVPQLYFSMPPMTFQCFISTRNVQPF